MDITTSPPAQTSGSIQVCLECNYASANGIDDDLLTSLRINKLPMPWNLYEGTETRLMPTPDYDNELLDDGFDDFSTIPCGGCGTTLAGVRFRFATWEDSHDD